MNTLFRQTVFLVKAAPARRTLFFKSPSIYHGFRGKKYRLNDMVNQSITLKTPKSYLPTHQSSVGRPNTLTNTWLQNLIQRRSITNESREVIQDKKHIVKKTHNNKYYYASMAFPVICTSIGAIIGGIVSCDDVVIGIIAGSMYGSLAWVMLDGPISARIIRDIIRKMK